MEAWLSRSVRGKAVVKAWLMAKFQRDFHSIRPATDEDIRSKKPENLKVPIQFLAVPNRAILCFKNLTLTWLGHEFR
jgi:hypothetical protein